MTAAVTAEELVGCQEPTTLWVPPGAVSSAAAEVVELCESIGLILDPWQQSVLGWGLAEAAGGNWLAFEVACVVARQNGKGAIIEALELGSLFLFGDELVTHSAHEFKTAKDGFRRLDHWLTNVDWLRRQVRQKFRSNETVGFDLKSGQRLRFMARSSGSGRGFSGDKVILDEALILQDVQLSAVMPATIARRNPQIWYFSSAGPPIGKPREVSEVLGRLVRRGHAGGDPQLVFAEWAAALHGQQCEADCDVHDDPADPTVWARTNPGLGYRITQGAIAREFRAMFGGTAFAREQLSVGDYPTEDDGRWLVIGREAWESRAGAAGRPEDPVAFGLAATPDEEFGAVGVAGSRGGELVVQVVDHRAGTGWMVDRVVELVEAWKPCTVALDPGGPAGHLVPDLEAAAVPLLKLSLREMGQAFGRFVAEFAGDAPSGRHFDQPELNAAVAGAQKRPLADAWVLVRGGGTDESSLEAVMFAAYGWAAEGRGLSEPASAPAAAADGREVFRPTSRLTI